MRQYAVLWHRWVGLGLVLFLTVAGLTGSLLAFEDEIEAWLNPHLYLSSPEAGTDGIELDAYALRDKAQQQVPANAYVDAMVFHHEPGHSVLLRLSPRIDPLTRQPAKLEADEVFINPYSGKLQGARLWGDTPFKRETLLGFLFKLHYSLALPGPWGRLLFGIAAVLWTLDCFVAFYLTVPSRQKQAKKSFLSRWKPAWFIKWQAGAQRINFDIHRAVGLWLSAVLLVFAWSSVMFNLPDQVYKPVMSQVFEFDNSWRGLPALEKPLQTPALDWHAAHAAARQVMQEVAAKHGFTVDFEDSLRLDRRRGVYAYFVHSSADLREDHGNTGILIDANTGVLKGWWLPTGDKAGNTVSNWLGALHMGQVFGLPYRIFVCLMGVVVVVLSVTGLLIWLAKRKSAAVKTKAPANA